MRARLYSVLETVAAILFLAAVYLFIQYVTVVYTTSMYGGTGQFEWAEGWEKFICIYKECEDGVAD